MTTSVRTVFQPDAGTSRAWELARAHVARPRAQQPSLDYIREELALRDLAARYAYALDQGDLDGVMDFFTDDCVITNLRGTVTGTAAIRASYETLLSDTPRRRHLFCNVVVHLSEGLDEGSTTACYYAILDRDDAPSRTVSGLIVDTVVKRHGAWKIRNHTFCMDTMADLVPAI